MKVLNTGQEVRARKVSSIPLRYQGRRGVVSGSRRRGRGIRYEVTFPQRVGVLEIAARYLTAP